MVGDMSYEKNFEVQTYSVEYLDLDINVLCKTKRVTPCTFNCMEAT